MSAKAIIKNSSVPVTPSRVAGFLDFGSQNRFPQEIISAVNNSPTAGSCVKRRAQFISGNGFNDRILAELVVNRQGQTLDTLLRRTAWNVGFAECVCLHVQYNALGKCAGIRFVPWEIARLGMPDDFDNIAKAGLFPYIDSTVFKNKKKDSTTFTLFNPNPDVVQTEIEVAGGIDKYKGQLLYNPMLSVGDYYYHVPDWYKVKTAIETEPELLDYDYKQTVGSFSVSGIASYVDEENTVVPPITGQLDDPAPYRTAKELDVDSLEYQYQQTIGNRNAGSVIFQRFKTREAMASFKFDSITGAQLSERNGSLNDRNPIIIARSFEVPPELIGIRRTGGIWATGLELQAAVNFMYQTVNDYQRIIRQSFEAILNNWYRPLGEVNMGIENLTFFPEKTTTTNVAG